MLQSKIIGVNLNFNKVDSDPFEAIEKLKN